MPKIKINEKSVAQWSTINLADSHYSKPGEIDGILGAEVFPLILKSERSNNKIDSYVAIETAFGYVVMGAVPANDEGDRHTFFSNNEEPIEILEEVPSRLKGEPENLECERIFSKTVSRDVTSGRFTVALPFKYSPENLGNSKTNAIRRLLVLEKKLGRSDQLRLDYSTAILDFTLLTRSHEKVGN